MSPHFLGMNEVITHIRQLLEPLLEGTDMFVVNIAIKPTNNIKVFLDADSGFSIEKSATVNRKLYHAIEDAQMYPDGDFSLEVSSPGVDEPLTQMRQYRKNEGRKVVVVLNDNTEKTGMLKTAAEDHIILEVSLPKSKITQDISVPFSEIKKTVVQIIF